MKPRRSKWSPGGPNGAQETKMEPRRPKWRPGDPNGTQEAHSQHRSALALGIQTTPPTYPPPDKPIQNDSSHCPMLCYAMRKPRRPKWRPGGPN